ncbi:MAG: TIGR00282 family metallophosphoesterase [Fimbriimonadaceae bacterium]
MLNYKILFLGDIVGRPGRKIVLDKLPGLINEQSPLFVIANGENSAAGLGITPDIAEELFKAKVDAITLGNHAFNKREIYPYLDKGKPIIRPANLPSAAPGKGHIVISKQGVDLNIINLCGRVFLDGYDDPFREIDLILGACGEERDAQATGPHVFVDFHAEATSEKIAFGYHLDGRVTAVVGTHTHVQTSDEIVLPGGTAYLTDVGMCGPQNSVLGMRKDIILQRFLTGMPSRFEVADEPGVLSGVVITVSKDTGRASDIRRIRLR